MKKWLRGVQEAIPLVWEFLYHLKRGVFFFFLQGAILGPQEENLYLFFLGDSLPFPQILDVTKLFIRGLSIIWQLL